MAEADAEAAEKRGFLTATIREKSGHQAVSLSLIEENFIRFAGIDAPDPGRIGFLSDTRSKGDQWLRSGES
jgi:hypothetical protein